MTCSALLGNAFEDITNNAAEAYGFPSWYGAGASPYDTRAKLLSTRGTEDQPDSKQTSVLLLIGVYSFQRSERIV